MEPLHHLNRVAPDQTPAIVVTGASDGIGRALARIYATADTTLLLVGRNRDRLEALAAELRTRDRVTVHVLALDLTSANAIQTINETLTRERLAIDLLINSAGIGHAGSFADAQADHLDELLAVNVQAVARLTHRALRDMNARGRGTIINIASLGAYAPGPYQAMYYASKAFVLSLTEAIAHEQRGTGVHVMAVVPGPVQTRFHARMGAEHAWYLKLMPKPQAATVATWTRYAHALRLRVVAPGVVATLLLPAMKVLPHRLLMPIIGFLLKPPQR